MAGSLTTHGESQVFNESTSFEQMVRTRKDSGRFPASAEVVGRVVGVRRELALTAKEAAEMPQDILVNAGAEAGVSEGQILAVKRRIPILDPYRDNQQREIEVEFAKIRIIHVDKEMSVARIEKIESSHTGVGVGTRAILSGDYVGQSK